VGESPWRVGRTPAPASATSSQSAASIPSSTRVDWGVGSRGDEITPQRTRVVEGMVKLLEKRIPVPVEKSKDRNAPIHNRIFA
jgi:hypothetical protein